MEDKKMHCPLCGGVLNWGSDFMASDIDSEVQEEKDVIVSSFTCDRCGRYFEVYEPDDEEKEKDYKEYWNGSNNG